MHTIKQPDGPKVGEGRGGDMKTPSSFGIKAFTLVFQNPLKSASFAKKSLCASS
jgi:hypothetical protein